MLSLIIIITVNTVIAVHSQCLGNENCDIGFYCGENYFCVQCVYCNNDQEICHKSITACVIKDGTENTNSTLITTIVLVVIFILGVILAIFTFLKRKNRVQYFDSNVSNVPKMPPPYRPRPSCPIYPSNELSNNNDEIFPLKEESSPENKELGKLQSESLQKARPYHFPKDEDKPFLYSNEPTNSSNASFAIENEENGINGEISGDNNNIVNNETSSNVFIPIQNGENTLNRSTSRPDSNNDNDIINLESHRTLNGTGASSYHGILTLQECNNNHIVARGKSPMNKTDRDEFEEGPDENPQSHSSGNNRRTYHINISNNIISNDFTFG